MDMKGITTLPPIVFAFREVGSENGEGCGQCPLCQSRNCCGERFAVIRVRSRQNPLCPRRRRDGMARLAFKVENLATQKFGTRSLPYSTSVFHIRVPLSALHATHQITRGFHMYESEYN